MEPPGQPIHVAVGDNPIDPGSMAEAVGRSDSGATVLFLGTVRDHSAGKQGVTHLDYETYPEMVEAKILEIAQEAAAEWPVLSVSVRHRTGRVDLGEVSVAVAVSAEHRADAFAAAGQIIDELKVRAPIWKKEHWPGGAEWSAGS
jgi:molybdopterin synthase catalytic subunit